MFLEAVASDHASARSALDEGDYKQVSSLGHRIHGGRFSARHLGQSPGLAFALFERGSPGIHHLGVRHGVIYRSPA
jgi:hypothetical protein